MEVGRVCLGLCNCMGTDQRSHQAARVSNFRSQGSAGETASGFIQYPSGAERNAGRHTEAIAARAFELYQQRVHGESQQDQDWLEAEREIHLEEAAKKQPAA